MALTQTQPRYKDISLTFRANPVTGDLVKLVDDAAIKESVTNLVLTMFFEIPFHPEQGSAVMESLFDPESPITVIKIQKSIESVITNFEPRVTLIGVTVTLDSTGNAYNARIVYQINNQPAPVDVSIFLKKLR
jgi:phage baseplate assembly protein W